MAIENLLVKIVGDSTSLVRSIDNASRSTQKFGTIISVGITAPLVAFAKKSVDEFAKFNQAMTESTSIMGNLSEATVKNMEDVALALSGVTVQTPAQLAEAYFFLASAGMDAQQSIAALADVSKFATAGAFDMATATDLLTDAQSALGLSSEDLIKVSDVLVKANTLANASVQQFSESLTNNAAAALRSMNKDIEEGVAVLAAYADQGNKGMKAGSDLGRITRMLSASARENAKEHKELGFQVFDATGKMRKYADIIANLEQVTKGMSDETKSATLDQLGFNAMIQTAILPLIGTSEKIRDYEKKLRSAGGTTEEVARKQMRSFSNQMQLLRNRTAAAAIALGRRLAPVLMQINGLIIEWSNSYKELDENTRKMIELSIIFAASLGPVLIALGTTVRLFALLKPLIAMVGAVLSFIAGLSWPILAVVAAVVALGVGLFAAGGDIVRFGEIFRKTFEFAVDAVLSALRVIVRSLTATVGWMVGLFSNVFTVEFVNAVIEGVKSGMNVILRFGKWIWETIKGAFSGKINKPLGLELAISDFSRGASSANLLKTLGEISQEEFGLFREQRLDFRGESELVPFVKDIKKFSNEKLEMLMEKSVSLQEKALNGDILQVRPLNLMGLGEQ